MAKDDTKDQRSDAEDTDDVETTDTNDDDPDEVARKAAQRLAKEGKGKQDTEDDPDEDEDDPSGSGDEVDVDDEDVKRWLSDVLKTPEIKQVIRETSKEVAARVKDKTEKEVRAELEEAFDKRLKRIESRLRSGELTQEEADEEAAKAAERAAAATRRQAGEDEKADQEEEQARKEAETAREQKIRLRELQAYRREALSKEDRSKLVEAIVVVTPDMEEDDVDELIDNAKTAYTTIRKQVIAELRSKGWKSPRDLQRLAAGTGSDEEDEEDGAEEEPGVPTRDRTTNGLSKQRRQGLRERFRYGDKAGVS